MKRHYIYRMKNDTTGEFYIGKRSCNGEPSADVNYKGSGKVIKKKVKKHPEQWRKEILCFARDVAQLNQAERWAIGSQWRDNPLCLNLCPGGEGPGPEFWTEEERAAQATRRKKYFESEENRAAHSARRKKYFESEEARAALSSRMKEVCGTEAARAANSARCLEQWQVRLTSPEGDPVEIARSLVLDYIRSGYTFTQGQICVQNDELRQWCLYTGKKAVALLLSDCGWTYGANTSYTKVGIKQVDAGRKKNHTVKNNPCIIVSR